MLGLPFYIYRHIRPDTGEVFYIGKGSRISRGHSFRAIEKSNRNKWWCNVVSKNNGLFDVEIIYEADTEAEINKKEIEFIALYGRKDKGGTLVNLTDGGEGSLGAIVSEETRKKLSALNKGEKHFNYGKKLSEETCRRKSDSMKNSPKNLKGKKLPEWWRDKIRQTKYGERNPMFGKRTSVSKRVINVITNEVYDTILLAGAAVGLKGRLLHQYLSGHRVNKSPFVYLSTYNEIGEDACLSMVNLTPKQGLGNSKMVIDLKSGKEYNSAKEAAMEVGYSAAYLRKILCHPTKNKTSLRYKNGM